MIRRVVNSRTFSSRFFSAAAMKLNVSASSRSSSCDRISTRASRFPCATCSEAVASFLIETEILLRNEVRQRQAPPAPRPP